MNNINYYLILTYVLIFMKIGTAFLTKQRNDWHESNLDHGRIMRIDENRYLVICDDGFESKDGVEIVKGLDGKWNEDVGCAPAGTVFRNNDIARNVKKREAEYKEITTEPHFGEHSGSSGDQVDEYVTSGDSSSVNSVEDETLTRTIYSTAKIISTDTTVAWPRIKKITTVTTSKEKHACSECQTPETRGHKDGMIPILSLCLAALTLITMALVVYIALDRKRNRATRQIVELRNSQKEDKTPETVVLVDVAHVDGNQNNPSQVDQSESKVIASNFDILKVEKQVVVDSPGSQSDPLESGTASEFESNSNLVDSQQETPIKSVEPRVGGDLALQDILKEGDRRD